MNTKRKTLKMPVRYLMNAVLVALLFVGLSFLTQNVLSTYQNKVLLTVGINIILAVSLNVATGYLGQLPLGHAGFMAVGAYTCALFTKYCPLPGPVSFVLGLVLAAFVVVVPFWEPSNTGLATKDYNTAFWDGKSTVSFVYQQYGALAHSLLNGRLDLEADPPAALLALENPYDAGARDAAQLNDIHWDHDFYNGRYYVYFGIVPCLLFQLPFEALTGIQNLAYAPCMVVLGLLLLAACFGLVIRPTVVVGIAARSRT